MTEPWDEHDRLVGPESWRIISCALRALDEDEFSYVLIGGWALYAYGSAVPSIDTDLFLETKDFTRLTRLMQEECGVVPNGKLQVLPLDQPLKMTPRTIAEDRGPHAYEPKALLPPGRTERRTIRIHGTDYEAWVPKSPELAFAKLKAFHDRRLGWEAFTDPRVIATLPGAEQMRVRKGTEQDWRRKAGKDIYDFAFLLRYNSLAEILLIADRFELRRPLELSLRDIPFALREFAESLAKKNPQLEITFPFWQSPPS